MPTRTCTETEQRVLDSRRLHRRGQDWLAVEVGVPARTVSSVLRRHDMPRLCECDPLTGEVIRASNTTAVRYERDRPGELVQMDVKKIGRIPDGGGWRADGRGVARDRENGPGYDYVHSVVDDQSRLAYSEIHADERAPTCADFFARAIEFFAEHGVTIQRLITRNAWQYRHGAKLREVLADRRIAYKFIRPLCPWQNGKVERFSRTLASGWAYRQLFTSNTERTNAFGPWLIDYNALRRHSALGGDPPISWLASPT